MIICKIFRLTYQIHHLKNFDLIESHFEPLSVPCRYILVELSGNHLDSKKILVQPWSVPHVFSSLLLKFFIIFFQKIRLKITLNEYLEQTVLIRVAAFLFLYLFFELDFVFAV